jgi:hypothetical protein
MVKYLFKQQPPAFPLSAVGHGTLDNNIVVLRLEYTISSKRRLVQGQGAVDGMLLLKYPLLQSHF